VAARKPRQTQPESKWARLFKLAVVGGVIALVFVGVWSNPEALLHPRLGHGLDILLWTIALAVTELLPVPVTQVLRLSLSFPILLGVGILYPPLVVACIALVGEFDPREIKREIPFLTALFNRSQLAVSFGLGSVVFHALAEVRSPWFELLPVVLLATVASYLANIIFVVTFMHLVYRRSSRDILSELRVGALSEFMLSYLGLGVVGLVIARLYLAVGFWSVAAFILPLVFARQMFFRSMALEEAGKELKDREQVLRALSNRMAEERQDERMKIAAYLHDDLAQMLFRLTLQVEMAKKRLAQGNVEAVYKDLDGIASTKDQTSDAVRALIRDLHRSPIGRNGLGEAIQSFAEDISRGHPTEIVVNVVELSLPPPIQLLIYQIACEAAMNALKHAEADHIWVTLSESGDGVALTIKDNGLGFDTSAPPPEGHFGSVMMRERALVTGGTYKIESALGEGTTITASFPRVWVEEGTMLEANPDSSIEGHPVLTRKPPVGSTVGPPTSNGNDHLEKGNSHLSILAKIAGKGRTASAAAASHLEPDPQASEAPETETPSEAKAEATASAELAWHEAKEGSETPSSRERDLPALRPAPDPQSTPDRPREEQPAIPA
jgi:signal transduction histidine kinase